MPEQSLKAPKQNHALLYELQVISGLGLLLLVIVACALLLFTDRVLVGQWFLQAALLWCYIYYFTKKRLGINKAYATDKLYLTLGWGNRLTLLRGWLIASTGGFLFLPQTALLTTLLPAICYTLAALLDRLDGFVARRSQQVSLLGSELDITFDALGLIIAPLLAVSLGKIHPSYLLLSVAFYIYQGLLRWRQNIGLPLYATPPNPLRRTLAGFQMAFIAATLWPWLNPAFTTIASIAFMLPVLFGFVVDWWVVIGKLSAQSAIKQEGYSAKYLQPFLRIALVLEVLLMSESVLFTHAESWIICSGVLAIILILLGLAGRVGALILLIMFGGLLQGENISLIGIVVIYTLSWLLLLGTGRFSLWQWDDAWVQRYDGA